MTGDLAAKGAEFVRELGSTLSTTLQQEAADILAREGWTVTPPAGEVLDESLGTLHRW